LRCSGEFPEESFWSEALLEVFDPGAISAAEKQPENAAASVDIRFHAPDVQMHLNVASPSAPLGSVFLEAKDFDAALLHGLLRTFCPDEIEMRSHGSAGELKNWLLVKRKPVSQSRFFRKRILVSWKEEAFEGLHASAATKSSALHWVSVTERATSLSFFLISDHPGAWSGT
jgi:hypothetical protein